MVNSHSRVSLIVVVVELQFNNYNEGSSTMTIYHYKLVAKTSNDCNSTTTTMREALL
jgi:hypothetical protein